MGRPRKATVAIAPSAPAPPQHVAPLASAPGAGHGVAHGVPQHVAPLVGNTSQQVEMIMVPKQEYMRFRDSVHARLSTIQGMIGDFAADYLRQSNLLLGEPALNGVLTHRSLGNLDHAGVVYGGAPAADVQPPVELQKKERKKRQHDPHAPKRPLTPYFLYMQTARPIIAQDLGLDAPKGAVQEEGQRRWAAMDPTEKVAWTNAYQFNLRLYNARVHSYKHGNSLARDMNDNEAQVYADANGIPHPTTAEVEITPDHDVMADHLQGLLPADAVDEAEVPEPASAPSTPTSPEPRVEPAKAQTPKAKAGRKRKSTGGDGADQVESSDIIKSDATAHSEKKRKRAANKSGDAASDEPSKKSSRKKKAT